MQTLKFKVTIEGGSQTVEITQTDPLLPTYNVIQDGKQIALLHKQNSNWLTKENTCLTEHDIRAIEKEIDMSMKF